MSVQDYLIDHTHFDWPNLLAGWAGLLPPKFTVWLMNRFGDLFLVLPDDSVQLLEVGAGTLTKLAESQDEFCQKMDEGDNASEWLHVSLVDHLVAAGLCSQPGFCYSFRVPPVLGGEPTVENTLVLGIVEHYRTYASVHSQLRNVPERAEEISKPN
jgi:hypothetical protein